MLELLETIVKCWDVYIGYNDGFTFSTRLYPSDRYINHTDKDFKNGLLTFVSKIEEHAGQSLKAEIQELKGKLEC